LANTPLKSWREVLGYSAEDVEQIRASGAVGGIKQAAE
jgi:hypothetical protein